MGWSAERQETVRRLILDGYSHAQIAARLGLSRDTVSGGVRRYALTPGATVPEKRPRKEPSDLWTESRLTQPWGSR
jgi:hypothetical protein